MSYVDLDFRNAIKMISIRGGSGLGDALYVQAIARHLVSEKRTVEVCNDWPDIFLPIKNKVTISPFRRKDITHLAHYASRRYAIGTTQFEDCCLNANITAPVDLRLDWKTQNVPLSFSLHKSGKPVVLVQLPRAPFARSDGYGMALLPDCRAIQRAINSLAGKAYLVQVGTGQALYKFDNIDLDLVGKTSVSDLIDAARCADLFLGYCSFAVPLTESLGKHSLLFWAQAGLRSRDQLIASITPKKIIHRQDLATVLMDDCSGGEIQKATNAFFEQTRYSAAV